MRTEPAVSDPSAAKQRPAATAAAEPPDGSAGNTVQRPWIVDRTKAADR